MQRNVRELENVFSDAAAQQPAELPVPEFLMPLQPVAATAAVEEQPGKDAVMQVVFQFSIVFQFSGGLLAHGDVLLIRAGCQ